MPAERIETGVVLSGGGANGAYEVGVLKALLSESCPHVGGRPIDPEIYTGTSVGAFNAAVLAAREAGEGPAAAVERLERLWRERIPAGADGCGNSVFRFRTDPLQFAAPGCFVPDPLAPLRALAGDGLYLGRDLARRVGAFAASDKPLQERVLDFPDLASLLCISPFEQLVAETLDPAVIRDSPKKLRVTATNWEDGSLRIFGNEDFSGEAGKRAVLASAAIPGIFPLQPVDGVPYVDGAVLANTPLRAAIHACAPETRELVLHVVFLDPEVAAVPLPRVPSSLSTLFRLYTIAVSRSFDYDIEHVERINQALLTQAMMDRELTAPGEKRRTAKQRRLVAKLAGGHIPVTVHRYRPGRPLSGVLGLLDFERGRIERLIEHGCQDAADHDCDEAGCILAS